MEKRFNFRNPDVEDEWLVWENQPRYNKHVWAFIHYCRRQGDQVYVKAEGDIMNVGVRRKLTANSSYRHANAERSC